MLGSTYQTGKGYKAIPKALRIQSTTGLCKSVTFVKKHLNGPKHLGKTFILEDIGPFTYGVMLIQHSTKGKS